MSNMATPQPSSAERLKAVSHQLSAEWKHLQAKGVQRRGAPIGDILVVWDKSLPSEKDLAKDPLYKALNASREALGYAKDAWVYVEEKSLKEVVELVDPRGVLCADEKCAQALANAYEQNLNVGKNRLAGRNVGVLHLMREALASSEHDESQKIKRNNWELMKWVASS